MQMRRSMVYSRPPQRKIIINGFIPSPPILNAGDSANTNSLNQSQIHVRNITIASQSQQKREIESADSKRGGPKRIVRKIIKGVQYDEEDSNPNWKLLKIQNNKLVLNESITQKATQNLTDNSTLMSPKRLPRELSPRKNTMTHVTVAKMKKLELAKLQLKMSQQQQQNMLFNDDKQVLSKMVANELSDQKGVINEYLLKTHIPMSNTGAYRLDPSIAQKNVALHASPVRLTKQLVPAINQSSNAKQTILPNPIYYNQAGVNYINMDSGKPRSKVEDDRVSLINLDAGKKMKLDEERLSFVNLDNGKLRAKLEEDRISFLNLDNGKMKTKIDDERMNTSININNASFQETRQSPLLGTKKPPTSPSNASNPAHMHTFSNNSNNTASSHNISTPRQGYRVSLNFPKHNNNASNQRHALEQTKIAEIKKNLALSTTSSQRALQRKSSNHFPHQNDLFSHDISVFSENISNPDDENEFNMPYEDEEIEESTTTTRTQPRRVVLLQSVYEGRPATIFFTYPPCCETTRDISRTIVVKPDDEAKYDLKFKSGTLYCVIKAFEYAGFKRTTTNNWNSLWGKPKQDRIKDMNRYQKVNHFPGCWQLGRKDNLWRNLSRMKRQFPNDFNFVPNTYILNTDFDRFALIKEQSENKSLWIMKPCASACGRGIRLLSKKSKIKKKMNYLTQEYIANPHLINGLKYDLRIYVLVSSYDPLRIYLYNQGLVRFATQKYSLNNKTLKQRFVHLTNWSVNKHSDNFVKNEDTKNDDEGSKWSFQALFKKYAEMGINSQELFNKIRDIIIKTIISAEPYMLSALSRSPEHRNNCFELYGFDILVDSNLKPWIMEVNVCPSLNSSSPLDKKIKTSLISDMMNLMGYQAYDKKKYEEDLKKKTPGTEGRKYQYKNVNEIADLNEENCVEKLNPDDWNILFETDEEMYRRGDFERIYPLKENVENYAKYFEFQRYHNVIVNKWLLSKTNFLEKICKKTSNLAV